MALTLAILALLTPALAAALPILIRHLLRNVDNPTAEAAAARGRADQIIASGSSPQALDELNRLVDDGVARRLPNGTQGGGDPSRS